MSVAGGARGRRRVKERVGRRCVGRRPDGRGGREEGARRADVEDTEFEGALWNGGRNIITASAFTESMHLRLKL